LDFCIFELDFYIVESDFCIVELDFYIFKFDFYIVKLDFCIVEFGFCMKNVFYINYKFYLLVKTHPTQGVMSFSTFVHKIFFSFGAKLHAFTYEDTK
jgi:hypothetical protein